MYSDFRKYSYIAEDFMKPNYVENDKIQGFKTFKTLYSTHFLHQLIKMYGNTMFSPKLLCNNP